MFSEKGLHTYGTSLPLLELDEVPSKKPVYAQDQIATDEQGRRRFHGAFTGGFSAGYWNTVGSKEGWTPQSFKSSRSEKAAGRVNQRPEDFMDDEDRGEFGIAPKGLEIHDDFTGSEHTEQRKRKFLQNDLKPIPGEPVLHQLLKPIKDKVSVRILKAWGWRPGQGLGPRQTRKEKKKARERNKKELYLMEKYGCEMPSTSKPSSGLPNDDDEDDHDDDDDEDDDSDNEDITFAPEDYEAQPYGYKDDSYGIGYKPLSRQSVLGAAPTTPSASSALQKMEHINLFKPLEAIGKNNQKISFTGQAFGVGALEEDDDEDVYATDDLTRYDFSLESKKKAKKSSTAIQKEELVFEHFILDLNPEKPPEYKVEMPFGWQPRNWHQKRSRFAPMDARTQRNLERKFADAKKQGDDEMTREKRAQLLGEELRKEEDSAQANSVPQTVLKPSIMELQKQHKERQDKTKSLLEKISAKSSSFTKGGIITLEGEEKSMDSLTPEEISSCFKPFVNDAAKQKRYEEFLAKNLTSEKEIGEFLQTIQPVELSLWDRQMEQKEFVQAKKLYRPLKGIMSDRFVTESEVKAEQKAAEVQKDETKQVVVRRTKTMWKPHSLLCKRFNIAEPYGGHMEDEKKPRHKPKMSVFDYLETSVNKKGDFQTPVIIPKHIEKPQEIIQQTQEDQRKDGTDCGQQQASLEWQNVLEGKEKKTPEKAAPTFKPKTELEKKVVESLDKPITEKKELFKSIFSDSESDGEEGPGSTENHNKNELVASLSKPISAAAANLLRNNSPPRGIFKALFNAPTATVDLTKEKETTIDLTKENQSQTKETVVKEPQNELQLNTKPQEKERILFKPKTSREPKGDNAQTFNSYGPALPNSPPTKQPQAVAPSAASLDDKLLTLWQKHKTSAQVTEVWVEKSTSLHSSDSDDDSSTDDSSNTDDDALKLKKKSKKSKKKKSSDHKHKKHKDHKSSKKSKKSDKKKKKHKKK